MTVGEVTRAIRSKARVLEIEERKRASFDYIQADLIGRSISRLYGSTNKMPTPSEAYPALFSKEEENKQIQKKKAELSAIRFKQFANTFNKNFKEGGKNSE